MLLSSLNTGSTDLRDTEVQQPNTTETLSLLINSRAFSANSGQFEAGSTTTASSFLPSTPPFLFCSSISISTTSFSVVSLIAMVPDSECRMPTLMVSSAKAVPIPGKLAARLAPATAAPANKRRREIPNVEIDRPKTSLVSDMIDPSLCLGGRPDSALPPNPIARHVPTSWRNKSLMKQTYSREPGSSPGWACRSCLINERPAWNEGRTGVSKIAAFCSPARAIWPGARPARHSADPAASLPAVG